MLKTYGSYVCLLDLSQFTLYCSYRCLVYGDGHVLNFNQQTLQLRGSCEYTFVSGKAVDGSTFSVSVLLTTKVQGGVQSTEVGGVTLMHNNNSHQLRPTSVWVSSPIPSQFHTAV